MKNKVTLIAFCASLCLTAFSAGALGQAETQRTKETVTRELDDTARIASVMMDGDLCTRIVTERALKSIFTVDPRDQWAASDNFDVNHEPYIQAKKTLIRLSRLVGYPCDVNLWMPLPGKPDTVQVLIRNVNEWSQFWTWGLLTQPMPEEMRRVLATGKRETVTARPGMISVLAPVWNSLGDIVGLVEVVAFEPNFAAPQVHARNEGPSAGLMNTLNEKVCTR